VLEKTRLVSGSGVETQALEKNQPQHTTEGSANQCHKDSNRRTSQATKAQGNATKAKAQGKTNQRRGTEAKTKDSEHNAT
jgi:hypothetical protein